MVDPHDDPRTTAAMCHAIDDAGVGREVAVAQEADCVHLEDVTPAVAAAFVNDPCLIWSGEHGLYWRADAAGYTSRKDEAGRYTIGTAYAKTRHCDPDKRIEFHRVAATSLHDMQGTAALASPCKLGGRVEFIAGPIWAEAEDNCFTAEIQTIGGHNVVATVHGSTRDEAEQRQRAVLAALTPDATQTREAGATAEAFVRLCEALGIPATASAHLEVPRLLSQTREAEGVHWRTDVEAAPRDGSRILLMWHDHASLSPHVELGKMGCGGKGWCNTYGHAFTGEPTHWMPLPDAGSAVLNARGGA